MDLLYLCVYHLHLFPHTESSSVTSAYIALILLVAIVQLLSHVQLSVTPWAVLRQPPLSFSISQNLLKFTSIGLVMLDGQRASLTFAFLFCLQPFPASGSFP